jgi:hypothetical protein
MLPASINMIAEAVAIRPVRISFSLTCDCGRFVGEVAPSAQRIADLAQERSPDRANPEWVGRGFHRYLINVIGTSAKWMTFVVTEPNSRP